MSKESHAVAEAAAHHGLALASWNLHARETVDGLDLPDRRPRKGHGSTAIGSPAPLSSVATPAH